MILPEENDYLRQFFGQAMPDNLPPAVEKRLQNCVTAFRDRIDRQLPVPCDLQTGKGHGLGGFRMNRRIALVGLATTVLLAVFLIWQGMAAKSLSAMEKMAESIRKAKSYKSTITSISQWRETSLKGASIPGPLVTRTTMQTTYYLADGSGRTETEDRTSKGPHPGENGLTTKFTTICPTGKPGITLNHQTKTYLHLPPAKPDSFMDEVQSLGSFTGRADRELGIKEINDQKARGFQFDDARRLLPHNSPSETIGDVWIDVKSNLPIRLQGERKSKDCAWIMDVQWNLDFEANLFDTTPPEGYTDSTPKPRTNPSALRSQP